MKTDQTNSIKMAAVGDLLLTARSSDRPGRGIEALSDEIISLFKSCDLVFANLECTLEGQDKVPTEPRVLSTEGQIRSLADSGIHIVSLGNNHTFDCFDEGFEKTTGILSEIGIQWCGAGEDLQTALRAPVLEVNSIRVAFVCVVDKSSGPFRFAADRASGVAPLDMDLVCKRIRELKDSVNHVIVSPHWGMERYRIPSPVQMEQARAFVDAGAAMVLGHHPHVLQGLEFYRDVPILYSLGNFVASRVYWENGDFLTWSRFESTGCICVAELDGKKVTRFEQIPVVDDGSLVSIDRSGWGDRCIKKVNRLLAGGVTAKKYAREAFLVNTVKPVLSHLTWQGLKKIRPRHFMKLYRKILS